MLSANNYIRNNCTSFTQAKYGNLQQAAGGNLLRKVLVNRLPLPFVRAHWVSVNARMVNNFFAYLLFNTGNFHQDFDRNLCGC